MTRITPIATNRVNVRLTGSMTAPVIGAIEPGQVVETRSAPTLVGLWDTWLAVTLPNGTNGYTAAWLHKLADQEPQRIDMLDYMRGDGRIYDVDFRFPGNHWATGTERMQTQVDGRRFFHVKGGPGAPDCNWEELWFDHEHIWRGTDISPNEHEYYQTSEAGQYGHRWIPRSVQIGTRHFIQNTVTFRRKADGQPVPGKPAYGFSAWIEVRAIYPQYTFESGATLPNVVELWGYLHNAAANTPGQAFERYWYAVGHGLVGWADPARIWRSFYKTPVTGIGNLVRKTVPGVTLPALPPMETHMNNIVNVNPGVDDPRWTAYSARATGALASIVRQNPDTSSAAVASLAPNADHSVHHIPYDTLTETERARANQPGYRWHLIKTGENIVGWMRQDVVALTPKPVAPPAPEPEPEPKPTDPDPNAPPVPDDDHGPAYNALRLKIIELEERIVEMERELTALIAKEIAASESSLLTDAARHFVAFIDARQRAHDLKKVS